jgi:hypothetical protein
LSARSVSKGRYVALEAISSSHQFWCGSAWAKSILLVVLAGDAGAVGACRLRSRRAGEWARHRITAAGGVCHFRQTGLAARFSTGLSARTSVRSPQGWREPPLWQDCTAASPSRLKRLSQSGMGFTMEPAH